MRERIARRDLDGLRQLRHGFRPVARIERLCAARLVRRRVLQQAGDLGHQRIDRGQIDFAALAQVRLGLLTVAEPAIGHARADSESAWPSARSSARPRDTSPPSGSPVVASAARPRPYSTAPDRGSSACAVVEQRLRPRQADSRPDASRPARRGSARDSGCSASARANAACGLLSAVSASQRVTQVVRPPHVRRSECPGVDEARLRGIEVLGGEKQLPHLAVRVGTSAPATRAVSAIVLVSAAYRSRSCAWTSAEALRNIRQGHGPQRGRFGRRARCDPGRDTRP